MSSMPPSVIAAATRSMQALAVAALFATMTAPAHAHTKGISLSKYGLVDVSWSANLALMTTSDYYRGFNPVKLGSRHFAGLNLTSFDLAFTQDAYQFPVKWGLFTAWGPDEVGIEEAFLLFHKLPAQLQLKTGIFRVNFGKINQYHDHEWTFADPPLISTFLLGADGVHNVGAELSWQPPTPFFTEWSFSLMQAPVGDFERTFPTPLDAVSGAGDLRRASAWSRATSFFDLSDDSDLELGISAAVGRNKPNGLASGVANPSDLSASPDDLTVMGGLDFTYTYKPAPFSPYLRWTTEYMVAKRRNPIRLDLDRSLRTGDAPLEEQISHTLIPSDTVGGAYSELNYRLSYNWDVGARFDVVGWPTGGEDPQTRLTGAVRYFLNPVSRLNFQYAYHFPSGIDQPYHVGLVQLNVGGGTVTPGVGKFYNLF